MHGAAGNGCVPCAEVSGDRTLSSAAGFAPPFVPTDRGVTHPSLSWCPRAVGCAEFAGCQCGGGGAGSARGGGDTSRLPSWGFGENTPAGIKITGRLGVLAKRRSTKRCD